MGKIISSFFRAMGVMFAYVITVLVGPFGGGWIYGLGYIVGLGGIVGFVENGNSWAVLLAGAWASLCATAGIWGLSEKSMAFEMRRDGYDPTVAREIREHDDYMVENWTDERIRTFVLGERIRKAALVTLFLLIGFLTAFCFLVSLTR